MVLIASTRLILGLAAASVSTAEPPLAPRDGPDSRLEALSPLRTESPPVIDGVLDDPVWQDAPSASAFATYDPDYGFAMTGETHVYMAYDDRNLYFAFRALDPDPDGIRATVTSRDNMYGDDWVAINLDTFGDAQSLYALYSNPFGIQGDSRFASGTEDRGVDIVFYTAARISDEGYAVEFEVPLQSIRFAAQDPVQMGVIFERNIARLSQRGTSPPLDPDQGQSWLTQMQPMTYPALEAPRLAEFLPAVTYAYQQAAQQGTLATEVNQADVSLTGKYGITSDLVADATYNPDFSQVEADAGQVDVNLRYDLFFPEKRPFFLEGREQFGVAATGKTELDPLRAVVYTRTIVDPIVGAKLTGKVGDPNTVASIYAVDELQPDGPDGQTEYAHVPILRYKRSLSDDSFVGGIYVGREAGGGYNRVGGADGQYRLTESTLVSLHGLWSGTAESGTAPRRGHSAAAQIARATRGLDFRFGVSDISTDFEANTGFLTRSGLTQASGVVTPRFYPSLPHVRRIDVPLISGQTRDHESGLWETFNRLAVTGHVFGAMVVRGSYTHATEVFQGERFNTGGWRVLTMGQVTNQLTIQASYRRGDAIFYSEDPFQGRSNRITGLVQVHPWPKVEGEASFTHVDFNRSSDDQRVFDYQIYRGKLTYQTNRFFFLRAILEYNDFRRELLSDLLASFTYIPGTVVHVGYGSLHDKTRWDVDQYVDGPAFLQTRRRFFFKTSYLFRN